MSAHEREPGALHGWRIDCSLKGEHELDVIGVVRTGFERNALEGQALLQRRERNELLQIGIALDERIEHGLRAGREREVRGGKAVSERGIEAVLGERDECALKAHGQVGDRICPVSVFAVTDVKAQCTVGIDRGVDVQAMQTQMRGILSRCAQTALHVPALCARSGVIRACVVRALGLRGVAFVLEASEIVKEYLGLGQCWIRERSLWIKVTQNTEADALVWERAQALLDGANSVSGALGALGG